MFDTFGNKVKINFTPETEKKELAGKIGEVFGKTTPSMMDFEIIGTLKEDVAINVHFEELEESFWFAEEVLEYINNGQGAEITLDGVDKKWTKRADDEWIEEDTIPQKNNNKWWQFWK
jgi:hypothetical protein